MAASKQQNTLKDRLSDIEYMYFLKAVLNLFCVKEGLETFITQESIALHKTLLAKSKPCGKCTQNDLENDRRLCSNCEKFKEEIKKNHQYNTPIWSNTNVQKWPHDHWSVARCFMNPGQSQHASAADADISALLNFIIHCKVFYEWQKYGNIRDYSIKVRKHRNGIFHRGKDKLKKKDLDDWTKDMIQLLENPNGKLKNNPEAKTAITSIKEVLTTNFIITLDNENKVKIASLEAQMYEAKTLLQEHSGKLQEHSGKLQEHSGKLQEHSGKLQKLQNDSTSQDQEVETLRTNVDTIQTTIEKIQESLDKVRTGQTMTDEEVSQITAEIKAEFKSVWDHMEQLNNRVDKLETDVENLKSDSKEVKTDVEILKSDSKEVKTDVEILKSESKETKKAVETLQNQNSETKTTDLSRIQKEMITSYKPHQKIQLNPVFLGGGTSRDLTDFYTNIILEKEHEQRVEDERKRQNKKTEQIKSLRQLFWKANVPIYRIALKGKAGLGKSTFLKFLLKTWCTFHNNRLNEVKEESEVKEGLVPTLNESDDDFKDGDVMLKFDILLFVNLSKISNEKDIIEVIDKQIPCLDHHHLPDNYLHNLMRKPDDNKVLMLMDALDEMDSNAPSTASIEQVIKGELYPNMIVIVASRPWKIDKLHQTEPPASIDIMIDMKGFSEENSKLFAEKILNCNKDIERFWDDVSQNVFVKTLINIPILMLFLVQVWHKDKSFPQTVTQLYLKMLDIIGKRHKEKTRDTRKDASVSYPVEKLKMFPNLQNLAITKIIGEENLLACCNIAYQFLIDGKHESPQTVDEVMEHLGNYGDSKWDLALNLGIVSQEDCTKGDDDSRKVSVSFSHMTIQEFLAAISLCYNENNFTHFLNSLKTYHDALQRETIITFIAGISSKKCKTIFKTIYETSDDQPIYENKDMAHNLCTLYMKCVREAEKSAHFRLKHLCIDSSEKLNTIVPRNRNIQDIRSLMLEDIDFTSDDCKSCFSIFECDKLEYLALKYIKLNDIDWKQLLSPGLISLELAAVTMSSMSSKLLCDALSQCTNLKKLKLRNAEVNVTISGLNLSKCTNLGKLTLKDIKIGDGKLDMPDSSCLSKLCLENVTISSLNLSKCTNLEKLTLKDIEIGDGKLDMPDSSCLSKLCLENVTISSLNLSKSSLLQELTLEEVQLGDCNLDLTGACCLSQVRLVNGNISSLNLSNCINLEELTLKNVKLADDNLNLHDYSHLHELKLVHLFISSESLSKCTKLTKLTLNNVILLNGKLDIQDYSCLPQPELAIEAIPSLSLSNCTNLKELTLKNVKLCDGKLDLPDASDLSLLVLENVTVSSLNLSKYTNLEELTLKAVKINDDKLDLPSDSSLSQLWLEIVTIHSLNLSDQKNLEELTLKDVQLVDEKLVLPSDSCLSRVWLENEIISSLNLSNSTNLQELTLKNVKLCDGKLDMLDANCLSQVPLAKVAISSLILSNCKNLKELTLKNIKLGDGKLDLQNYSCLSLLKLENITLYSLNLSKCKLRKLTLKDVKIRNLD